jgi:hypothetical protein
LKHKKRFKKRDINFVRFLTLEVFDYLAFEKRGADKLPPPYLRGLKLESFSTDICTVGINE